MTSAQVRHQRGLLVVILLGIIFLALLGALIFTTGKHPIASVAESESLSVLPLRIRLRTQPSASAPVVATETEGTKLRVLEDRGAWVRVQDDEGMGGWAERNSLERTSERARRMSRYEAIRQLPSLAAMVTARTPLYAGPGIFYPIIGELPSDSQVRVYTRDHDFYAIDNNGQIAYADVDAIDVSSAGTRQLDVSTATPPPTETAASAAPPPTETETAPAPTPPTETTAAPVAQGVYSAVPLGGTQPEEIDRVLPRYPGAARRAGVQGPVVVRGIVRKDGTIDDVEVIKDLPNGLGDAAREAVSRWRFRPATYRGEPIDVYYTVTVNFRLTP
ncbi:MAG TPA: TonB family protein [Thermoanaerobaculia bacterium]|nr:TonB family protein [Thermoanaerobaculia bacterium]